MGIKLVFFASILLNYFQSTGQEVKKDSLNLSIYTVNLCLSDLLFEVVKCNKKYYNDEFYFSLSLVEGTKVKYISIIPQKWSHSRFADYHGALKVSDKVFLIRGDINSDSLFMSSDLPGMKVSLQVEKEDSNVIGLEPSIHGYFNDCKGRPIYIEIYAKGKMTNYKKKLIISPN